ncbi:MAG: diguanylate cyclase, partial [Bradyrhizobium sp.]|nr:diguanylate cyclase [Bradyrhizobium sp.]
RLGETLAQIAQATDAFAGRYGGEEFCLLIPGIDARQAFEIGEQIRYAVLELNLPHATSAYRCVTVSVGVASARPNDALATTDLIEAADAALYAAKHHGRNTVIAHGLVDSARETTGVARAG